MIVVKSTVVLLVACLVSLCQGQTLTYSAGWVNGKRSGTVWPDIVAAGHHGDPRLFPVSSTNCGLVPISDSLLGKNYMCFVVNSQQSDNFGLKSADYPYPKARPVTTA